MELALAWTKRSMQGVVCNAEFKPVPHLRPFSAENCAFWKGRKTPVLRCDASPWGFGGAVEVDGSPQSWCADAVTPKDRSTFAILISMKVWQHTLSGHCVVCVEGDSKATFFACAKLSSSMPTMNAMVTDIVIRVVGAHIELGHIPGVGNYEAKVSSSLQVGNAAPAYLRGVARVAAPARSRHLWIVWPRELAEVQSSDHRATPARQASFRAP